jgi:hypothetical protein
VAPPVSYTELDVDGGVLVLAHGSYFAEEVEDGVMIREAVGLSEIDETGVWILHAVTVTPPDDPDALSSVLDGTVSRAGMGSMVGSMASSGVRFPSVSGILPGVRSDASVLSDGHQASRKRFGSMAYVEQRGD